MPSGKLPADVDSIPASISRLRLGSGTVRETPKSHYSRRTRARSAAARSYPESKPMTYDIAKHLRHTALI